MPILTMGGLTHTQSWNEAGVTLPGYDVAAARKRTLEAPCWLHFGAGNIFRGFLASLPEALLNAGITDRGVIAAELFDADIISQIYNPYDSLVLSVTLRADGSMEKSITGAIAAGYSAQDMSVLRGIFERPSLQMVSYTITEKGYALTDMKGDILPLAAEDMKAGPDYARHAMAITAALLLSRYRSGGAPIAMVSMDNCSRNGDRLRDSVLEIATAWRSHGFVDDGFVDYLSDPSRVSFPWSMIDKITPRPSDKVAEALLKAGVEGMKAVVTGRGTYIAPFVNAEAPQYLVIEDTFPAGRPPLEKSGVFFVGRDTVNKTERMKVTTCLNPLHSALAVFGCLLGYDSIAKEMSDPQLNALVRRIGYDEGLPVVVSPGIIDPRAFLDEVVNERLPNPFVPDTPQRIATDTSQKVAIRFGETIKAYVASGTLSPDSLIGIPLALAGWLRYLLGTDDNLAAIQVSGDPMLGELQSSLAGIIPGDPESCGNKLCPILSNAALFGVDLREAGLAERVEELFRDMLKGQGAVRALLTTHFPS